MTISHVLMNRPEKKAADGSGDWRQASHHSVG